MPREELKLGTQVVYVTGTVLTRGDTGEAHAGHSMGGSHTPGKELLAFVTKAAAPPEDENEPYTIDLLVVKHDPNTDLVDFGANTAVIHGVPYGETGEPNTWHGLDEDVAAARAAAEEKAAVPGKPAAAKKPAPVTIA